MTRFDWIKSGSVWMRLATAAAVLTVVSCSGMDHSHHGEDSATSSQASVDSPVENAPSEMEHSEMEHGDPAAVAAGDGHDHAADEHGDQGHGTHDHPPLVVPADQPAPTLTIVVTPDPASGWNLELQTTNFEFAPERVNGESTFNEGHAHLIVNGEKRGRIYSNWYHLTGLTPGENTVEVTLNANGHEALVVDGEVVADTVVVTLP